MKDTSEIPQTITDPLRRIAVRVGLEDRKPEVIVPFQRVNPELLKGLEIDSHIWLGDYSRMPVGQDYWNDWETVGMEGGPELEECYVDDFILNESGERVGIIARYGRGPDSFIVSPTTGIIDTPYVDRDFEHAQARERALQGRSREKGIVKEELNRLKIRLGSADLQTIDGSLSLLTEGLIRAFGNEKGSAVAGEVENVLGKGRILPVPIEASEQDEKLSEINAVPGLIYCNQGPNGLTVFTVVEGPSREGFIPVKLLNVTENEGIYTIQRLVTDHSDRFDVNGVIDPDTVYLPAKVINVVKYNSRQDLEMALNRAQGEVDILVQGSVTFFVSELIRVRETDN